MLTFKQIRTSTHKIKIKEINKKTNELKGLIDSQIMQGTYFR